jgi:hypothetical protein
MKKLLVGILAMSVVLVGIVAVWLLRRPRARRRAPQLRAMMRDEDTPRPIEPSLALRVNETKEATVFAGTPVWLTVNASNAAAINELAAAGALSERLARLSQDVTKGIALPEERDRVKSAYEKRLSPAKITLGDAAHPWTDAVQFLRRDEKGGQQPLGLDVRALDRASSVVELDAVSSTEASFGTASANLLPGTYPIVACLGATGSWQGRVCSGPVKLTVLAPPEQFSPEQQLAVDHQSAQFGLLAGDSQALEKYGRELLAADPSSVTGHCYLGEARFRQGNWSEALEEFVTARSEFRRQHPDALDLPRFFSLRINRLMEKVSTMP